MDVMKEATRVYRRTKAGMLGRASLDREIKAREKRRIRDRRRVTAGIKKSILVSTSMDDSIMFNENTAASGGVIFGVYGSDDWATCTHLRKAMEEGRNTLAKEGTWVTPSGWDFSEFVSSSSTRFNFISMHRAIIFFEWGIIEASVSKGKLVLVLNGTPECVIAFTAGLDKVLRPAENLIEWVYSPRGDSISVPLNYRPAIEAAYPWLPKPMNDYIDDYLDSQASVLILIGPPGTGKTTFIKNLIHRSKGDARVTYDETVMSGDSLFAEFIESDAKFMIMEDADTFLKSRDDGNTMMHRFLNVSDGLISAQDKKLVFSTNLPSVRDIDSALMRPGRCFDVIEFRALTRAEAEVIADEMNLELPDGRSFTLAEMFNVHASDAVNSDGTTKKRKVKRVGFLE